MKTFDYDDDDDDDDYDDDDDEYDDGYNLLCLGSSQGGKRDQRERREQSQLQRVGSPTGDYCCGYHDHWDGDVNVGDDDDDDVTPMPQWDKATMR